MANGGLKCREVLDTWGYSHGCARHRESRAGFQYGKAPQVSGYLKNQPQDPMTSRFWGPNSGRTSAAGAQMCRELAARGRLESLRIARIGETTGAVATGLEKLFSLPIEALKRRAVAAYPKVALRKEENMSFIYRAMLACLFGSLVILPTVALAENPATAKPNAQTQSQTEDKRKTLMADATSAIQETQSAMKHLDNGNTKEALAALERATGKLDVILARDPTLELAPAGVGVTTYDVQGGLDAVNKVRKQAQNFMDAGQLQQARHLLKNLASETVISVTNIPLATYPDAIKSAVKFIDQNKKDEAKRVLQTALNTQVVTDTIIPLPIVKAQEALKNAEGLAEKQNRTKDDNDQLKASMDQARGQLEFAQALGYGTKKDFDMMYAQLTEIQEKIADNKFGAGWFAKIKASIADFLKSSQSKNS